MKIKNAFCLLFSIMILLSSCSNKTDTQFLSDAIVAVEIDSLSSQAAESIKNEVKEIRTFSSEDGAVSAVETKNADLVVLDEFSYSTYIKNKHKLSVVKVVPFTVEYCMYFPKNHKLFQSFNAGIIDLLESGTVENIKASHKDSDGYYPKLNELGDGAPTLVMATNVAGAPYTDLSGEGHVVGIDIDIATIIANSLGYELEIVVTAVDDMFRMLSSGEADFAISGLMYSQEREAEYDCSLSYLSVDYYLLERD